MGDMVHKEYNAQIRDKKFIKKRGLLCQLEKVHMVLLKVDHQ